jgi:hypothetical protein
MGEAMRTERGEGRVGCLLMIAVLIAAGFITYRIVPVYLDKIDFEDQLARIASEGGARNWQAEAVQLQVLELARIKDFAVSRESIRVAKAGSGGAGQLRIDVQFQRTVDFAGYDYTFKFESKVKSFVGSL